MKNKDPGRRLLLVDVSNQVWRNLHVHFALTHEGKFTGGLCGFLTSTAKYINDVGASDVVICCDRKPYVRSLEYPQYKNLRAKTVKESDREAMKESMTYVDQALSVLGLPVMAEPGFESDDCMAMLAWRMRNRFELIVAASNDSDLWQLLYIPNFRCMGKDWKSAIDSDTLYANTGLSPEQYVAALALSGTHNDVEGIAGVGPVKSAAAVLNPALMREYRDKYLDMIKRNTALIKLPHRDFSRYDMPLRTRKFNSRDFYRFCGEFGITATADMVNAFERVSS